MLSCTLEILLVTYLLTYLTGWSSNKGHKTKLLLVVVLYLGLMILDNQQPDGLWTASMLVDINQRSLYALWIFSMFNSTRLNHDVNHMHLAQSHFQIDSRFLSVFFQPLLILITITLGKYSRSTSFSSSIWKHDCARCVLHIWHNRAFKSRMTMYGT